MCFRITVESMATATVDLDDLAAMFERTIRFWRDSKTKEDDPLVAHVAILEARTSFEMLLVRASGGDAEHRRKLLAGVRKVAEEAIADIWAGREEKLPPPGHPKGITPEGS